jgi:prepilin-type processing-associated H-X9-DG protein
MSGALLVSFLTRLLALWGLAAGAMTLEWPGAAWPETRLSELQGTFWRLDRIHGIADGQANGILRISKHYIEVSAGCHYALFTFDHGPGAFRSTESRGMRTGSHCPAMPTMPAIEAGLAKVKRHAVDADSMTLLDDRGRSVMALSRITANGLENREWSISEYWDGKALVAAEHEAYIAFWDGHVAGSPGCGGFLGGYTLSGEHLDFHATVLLAGSCPEPALTQMRRAAEAFDGVVRVRHDQLGRTVLQDAQSLTRVVLRPQRGN